MSKVNINKMNDLDAIRALKGAGVKPADKGKTESVETKSVRGEDTLKFSERGREVGQHVEQLKDLPDVRRERVEALRGQIAAGEYHPSGEEIAAAILRDEG